MMNRIGDDASRDRKKTFPPVGHLLAGGLLLLLGAGLTASASEVAPADMAGPVTVDEFHVTDDQLHDLIAILLAENPQILSAQASQRSSQERIPQARSLPDPQVTYRVFASTPETRVGPQRQALEVSQGVPWGSKRELQAERAARESSDMSWRVRDLQRDLVADLKKSYFELIYLRRALATNAEETALLQRFERIALKRYETGGGIQQNVIKVQTELTRLEDDRTRLEELRHTALRKIATLIGRPQEDLALAPTALSLIDVTYDDERLQAKAIQDHPEVHGLQQRVQSYTTLLRRRSLDSRPDFRFGVSYTEVDPRRDLAAGAPAPEDDGKDIVALTVGLNIPLYRSRIRAGVAEADEGAQSAVQELEGVRNRLRFEIQESVLRVESVSEREKLFKSVLIPQAETSLASAEAAYITDKLAFLDLLDAERVLFQVRLMSDRLLSDFWIALADLERALGSRFPEASHAASGDSNGDETP